MVGDSLGANAAGDLPQRRASDVGAMRTTPVVVEESDDEDDDDDDEDDEDGDDDGGERPVQTYQRQIGHDNDDDGEEDDPEVVDYVQPVAPTIGRMHSASQTVVVDVDDDDDDDNDVIATTSYKSSGGIADDHSNLEDNNEQIYMDLERPTEIPVLSPSPRKVNALPGLGGVITTPGTSIDSPKKKPNQYNELPPELAEALHQKGAPSGGGGGGGKIAPPVPLSAPPKKLSRETEYGVAPPAAPMQQQYGAPPGVLSRHAEQYGMPPPEAVAQSPHRQRLHRTTRTKELHNASSGLTVKRGGGPLPVKSDSLSSAAAAVAVAALAAAEEDVETPASKLRKKKKKKRGTAEAANDIAAATMTAAGSKHGPLIRSKNVQQLPSLRGAGDGDAAAGTAAGTTGGGGTVNTRRHTVELGSVDDASNTKRGQAFSNLRNAFHNRSFFVSGDQTATAAAAAEDASAGEHKWKQEKLPGGSSCAVCRSPIDSVFGAKGQRCTHCGDTLHSGCSARAKYRCQPSAASPDRESPRGRRRNSEVPDDAADTRYAEFMQLVKASQLKELTKAFSDADVREMMRRVGGSDKDVPIVTAMRMMVYSPSVPADAMFEFLLQRCDAALLSRAEVGAWTPLLWAIEMSTENSAPLLMLKKVPNLVVARDTLCHFARHYRLPDGVADFVEYLIALGADVNCRGGSRGDTPLHYACSNLSIGPMLVSALVANGANASLTNNDGVTPLFACVFYNNVAVAQQLLDLPGVSPTPRNRDGKTPAELCEALPTHAALREILVAAAQPSHSSNTPLDSLVADDELNEYDDIDLALQAAIQHLPSNLGGDSPSASAKPATTVAAPTNVAAAAPTTAAMAQTTLVKTATIRRTPVERLTESGSKELLAELDNDLSRSVMDRLRRSSLIDDARKRDMIINYRDVAFYERLGSGTFGQVFRGTLNIARALSHGAKEAAPSSGDMVTIPVAIKQLVKTPTGKDDRRTASFLRQFEVWTALNHQNLVFLYGVVLKPSLLLVMEHVSRGSLLDVLQAADHRIDWVRALAWVADVALGTSALHEHSPPVFHRDLKPSNVLVDEHWRLKIADFDTARLLESENFATFEGKLVGSPGYLPPEMMQGGTFTAKGDVYSIGIMLNELAVRVITGSHVEPYTGCDLPNLAGGMGVLIFASSVKHGRPLMPSNMPPLFRTLVENCWHHDIDVRPTCSELQERLKPMVADLTANRANWPAACDGK
jgi:hypothetical protein